MAKRPNPRPGSAGSAAPVAAAPVAAAPVAAAPVAAAPVAAAPVAAAPVAAAGAGTPTSRTTSRPRTWGWSTIVWCIVAIVIVALTVGSFFWNKSSSDTNAKAIGDVDTRVNDLDKKFTGEFAKVNSNLGKLTTSLDNRFKAVQDDANGQTDQLRRQMQSEIAEAMKPKPADPKTPEAKGWAPRYSITGDLLTMAGEDMEAAREARNNLSLGGRDFGLALVKALDSGNSRIRQSAKAALRARYPRDNGLLAEVARNPGSSGSARAAAEEILRETERIWRTVGENRRAIQSLDANAKKDRVETAAQVSRLDKSQAETNNSLNGLVDRLEREPDGIFPRLRAYTGETDRRIGSVEKAVGVLGQMHTASEE